MAQDIGALLNLQTLARALGGEVKGGQVTAPGPGHSATDRSLSVKLDSGAPDGFVVNSFAKDDPIVCRDYVREKAGLPAFIKPNGRGRGSDDVIERAVMAAAGAQGREKPKGKIITQYDYCDADGTLLYQVLRYEPKDFRQRQPDGNGGWTWKLDERPRCVSLAGIAAISRWHRFCHRGREGRGSRRCARTLRNVCGGRQMD